MRETQSNASPAFRQSCEGLLRLHRLRVEGKHDSDEADLVRDELADPWYEMTPVERERIGGLSEDLYTISDPLPEMRPMNPQVQKNLAAAQNAYDKEDWDEYLGLLRRWKQYLSLDTLSFLRSSAWARIGEHEIALEFAEHALSLNSNNEDFIAQRLQIMRDVDPARAIEEAEKINSNARNHKYEVSFVAILILFSRAAKSHGTDLWKSMVPLADHLVATAQTEKGSTDLDGLLYAFAVQAQCQAKAGNTRKAIELYDFGIRNWPSYPGFWAGRGILTYDSDRSRAVADLERAIRYRPMDPAPLVFLAHSHLMAGRYSKAIDYIDKRLSLTMRDDLQGLLLEWKAVAFSELRVEQSQVVQLFDEAIRLNPASESAIRNRNLFADSPSKPERSNGTEWQIETPNIGIEYSTLDLPKHKLPKPKFDLAA